MSVIVPIYNVAPFLDKCISSIIRQTYKELEIILVDDGSTDTSGDICDMYAKKDTRICVIHKKNGGLVSARKAGISIATGEYVGYVDGDDWIEPYMYETMLQLMLQYQADMVETNHFKEVENDSIVSKVKLPYGCYDSQQLVPQMLCDMDFNECNLSPYVWSKLFKKNLLQRIQLDVDNAISLGEDAAVSYPYVLLSEKVVVADYAGYHYVQRKDSIVNSRKCDELYRNMILLFYLLKKFVCYDGRDSLLHSLHQYAKILMLLRDVSYFDNRDSNIILSAFGGISREEKVIIYGAGKLGQNVYGYLSTFQDLEILSWLDREADTLKKWGFATETPEKIKSCIDKDCKIIIAIINRKAVTEVKKYLLSNGIDENRVLWLTEDFIQNAKSIFEMCEYRRIAICGFGKCGMALFKRLEKAGYVIPYVIEQDCHTIDEFDKIGKEMKQKVELVGLDKDVDFYKKADILIVSDDLDYESSCEKLKMNAFPIQIFPQNIEVDNFIRDRFGSIL